MNTTSMIWTSPGATCPICHTQVDAGARCLVFWGRSPDAPEEFLHVICGTSKGLRWKPHKPESDPRLLTIDHEDLYWIYEDDYKGSPLWSIYKNNLWLGDTRTYEDTHWMARFEIETQNLSSKKTKKGLANAHELVYNMPCVETLTKPDSLLAKEAFMPPTVVSSKPAAPKKPAVATPKKPATAPPAAAAPVEAAPEETKAPKARIGLSQDEVDQIVAGNVPSREVVGTADQESLGMTDAEGRPKGRPIGVTTGLPICAAWCAMFIWNEQRSGGADDPKWTDEQISNWMKSEFPGRNTPAFDHPAGCRKDYNAGRFTKGVAPQVQSSQYDASGNVVVGRTRGAKVEEAPAEVAPAPAAPPAPKAAPKAAPAKPAVPVAKPAAVTKTAPAAVVRKPAVAAPKKPAPVKA